jgi:hypothetical protein
VAIPAIGVDARVEALGLDRDGRVAAPVGWDDAGWFSLGPRPGQPGPAIVAGHVDSPTGPAVFHRLGELRPGATVEVRRADRTTVRFGVQRVERYPKDAFPEAEVYGPAVGPELRLITCGGAFDTTTGHYVDNVVVYAVAA